ncbi:unnamed protein product [Brugia timori]|uniref:SH2 domain-containing protein n=1 Tax=Brugia timori TaxID=42155 RepID=A0A0R3R035_9BILA|nr:unnamed protein product [Brugia timori]
MTDSSSSAVDKLDTDENNSNESESSPSPPSYAVFEDEHGNLVNPALNVIWPMRPRRGRYSLKEYREQKQRFQKHSEQQRQNKKYDFKSRKQSKGQLEVSHSHATEQTKDSSSSSIYMPIKMPLMLAYMSSSGKIYNFGFKRHEFGSESFWQLDLSGIEDREQPLFRSMSALIQYYKSLVIDRGDGKTEIFPVD